MTCKRHSYVWIPRSAATFENKRTGELVAFDIGICQKCGHYKPRIHVWGPGEQVEAQIWGEKRFEVKKVDQGDNT